MSQVVRNRWHDIPTEREVSEILDCGCEMEIYVSNGNIYVECVAP